jgi:hypothetical protein
MTGSSGWRRSIVTLVGNVILLAAACILGGCYAATAGLVVGFLALTGGGSGGSAAIPLRVDSLEVGPPVTPDRIEVQFRLAGGSGSDFSAKVEYALVDPASGEEGAPFRATPGAAGEANPQTHLRPEISERFVWDAKGDLRDGSAEAVIVVTPIEDGVEGKPMRSAQRQAGNTPPRVLEVELAQAVRPPEEGETLRAIQILITFLIQDDESNPVDLTGLDLAAGEGGPFLPIPATSSRRCPRT